MAVQKVVSWIDTSLAPRKAQAPSPGKKGKLFEYHLAYLHKGNELPKAIYIFMQGATFNSDVIKGLLLSALPGIEV